MHVTLTVLAFSSFHVCFPKLHGSFVHNNLQLSQGFQEGFFCTTYHILQMFAYFVIEDLLGDKIFIKLETQAC